MENIFLAEILYLIVSSSKKIKVVDCALAISRLQGSDNRQQSGTGSRRLATKMRRRNGGKDAEE
jgi:hypothetical protein